MDIIIPILFLLLPPLYLGMRYFIDYGKNAIDGLGTSEKFAAALFLVYVVTVLFIGKDSLYGLIFGINDVKKLSFYFIFPSLGFGFAMFPKTVTEYFGDYTQFSETSSSGAVKIIGWGLLITSAISIFAYATM